MKKYLLILSIFALFACNINFVKADATTLYDCGIARTLRAGLSGNDVACLQSRLGISADGRFGPMTKAAVLAWQRNAGLVADGIFGVKSRATFIAYGGMFGSLAEGCISAVGYSPTTGKPCVPSKKDADITIINPAILPNATVNVFYSFYPKAVGGLGNKTWNNYGWTLSAGTLPPGLNLVDGSFVNGTPTSAGTYVFSLTASNGTISVAKEFTLTVDPASAATN